MTRRQCFAAKRAWNTMNPTITKIARQAAIASALTFALGAALPLLIAWLSPLTVVIPAVAVGSLLLLAAMGALASSAGGAKVLVGAARVTFWGAVAMAATAAIGALFGTTVA